MHCSSSSSRDSMPSVPRGSLHQGRSSRTVRPPRLRPRPVPSSATTPVLDFSEIPYGHPDASPHLAVTTHGTDLSLSKPAMAMNGMAGTSYAPAIQPQPLLTRGGPSTDDDPSRYAAVVNGRRFALPRALSEGLAPS